jgi:hypothetical protein
MALSLSIQMAISAEMDGKAKQVTLLERWSSNGEGTICRSGADRNNSP